LFVFIVVLLGAYNLFSKKDVIDLKSASSLPPATVAKAQIGQVVRYINAIGTLRPFDSVVIKSEVDSAISKVHFSEGTIVKANDLLIELDDAHARASLLAAEAEYRKARSEFEPTEKLADRGAMAKIERDKKKAEVDIAAAKVQDGKNNLEKHKIIAPFSGIVGLKEVSKGQYVARGNELLKLVDCHPLKVDFKVAEIDIGHIYVGQELKVLIGGDNTQEYSAKIIAIDPESDKISHTFDVRALLDVPEEVANQSRVLKPGRFVSLKVVPDENQLGILVPESALEKMGEEYFVFRLIDGIVVRTLVTLGIRKDGFVEIITGVNEGELVVTSGQHGIIEGRGVSIQNGSESLGNIGNKITSSGSAKKVKKIVKKKTTAKKSPSEQK
jgi:membrane fusion protein (multidrug efflux system)